MIRALYVKWDNTPGIVSFATKASDVSDIPFPAITICPEVKSQVSRFNFTDAYHKHKAGKLNKASLNTFITMWQICDLGAGNDHAPRLYDNHCIRTLRDLAVPKSSLLKQCLWGRQTLNCSQEFHTTVTDQGICYTFNSLSLLHLLRVGEVHPDFLIDGGVDNPPRRASTSGKKTSLVVVLQTNQNDLDYLCGSCIQGYKVQLHAPTDYPSLSNYIQVPLDQEVSVEVIPHLALTTNSIRHYSPDRRNCFFQEERKLRFFSVYSQANCELECLSNYTVKLCGCTRFSMPRARLVPVCGVGAMRCYQMAEYSLLQMDGCHCMPACSTLQYDAEISQADFDWHHMKQFKLDHKERIHLSYLIVYFKEPKFIAIKRSELYGDTEFLANCGGLLGLFLGVSLLSFAEILYYCTLKPFVLWWNWRRLRSIEGTD
ncbi:pickpocket protein 28-like [Culex pipiens pallens]|uniref:pickpocket protein 28-like n=1 Tax=Culex pipiens pallens TaxID=42434 RepID=UPI0019530AEB|nr:pickpocket protein 28-like [Culex pipiens pallens]